MKRFSLLAVIGSILIFSGIYRSLHSQPVPSTNLAVISNQQSATAAAVNLGNNVISTLCIKALHANTMAVYLGGSTVTTGTGMELQADQSWCGNLSNTNQIYLIGTGSISWIGTKNR